MSGRDDKWTMFKNYMHNELGVTKDDIRTWIREACKDIAKRMVEQEFGRFNVQDVVEKFVMDRNVWGNPSAKKRLVDAVAQELVSQVKITLR